MRDLETRNTQGPVALRAAQGGTLGGFALKFNRMSQNLGGFVEQIAPGALAKTVRDAGDVLCRFQHEDRYILGRTASGTLRLILGDEGLEYEVDLPDTTYARDLAALAARGDVQHSSFAFRTVADDWGFTDQGFPLRTLTEIQLVDVAPVVQPAYLDTSSGLRSLAAARHIDLAAVCAAAAEERLADVVRGVVAQGAEPGETHSMPAALMRRMAFLRDKAAT